MPEGLYQLTIREAFSASHCLRHYGGKCEALHGHNFDVEATVQGRKLDPKIHILMDFKELRTLLKETLAPLDHAHLNDLPAFLERNPSSENLAQFVYEGLAARLAGTDAELVSVTVSEKPGQSATYRLG